VLNDLELTIKESDAIIHAQDLPTVMADKTQIRQLFQNIISNSLKYRKTNIDPVIKIYHLEEQNGKSTDDAFYKIIFEDNGIGFDQKYADKIFLPFQRLHSRKQYAGTGIGLALCKRIVERHGGIITAEGKKTKGAKFIINLKKIHNNEASL
jgi:light-regulated signal transduction histidine kinase (bacteriophytochrome)